MEVYQLKCKFVGLSSTELYSTEFHANSDKEAYSKAEQVARKKFPNIQDGEHVTMLKLARVLFFDQPFLINEG